MLNDQLEVALAIIDRVVGQIDQTDHHDRDTKIKLMEIAGHLEDIVVGLRIPRKDPHQLKSVDLV